MNIDAIQFGKEIPLFPLPNCVLFPGVVQPLHIFEPRYREMMRCALEDQRVLAMALLKPGWEEGYYGCPAIHEVVCAGRVIAHEQLEDGKYNLLLQGLTRAKVVGERRHPGEWGVYRTASLQELPEKDEVGEVIGGCEAMQRKVLKELFEKTALRDLTVTPALASLFEEGPPMSRLLDALAFSMVQDVQAKQKLLEEINVTVRCELLMRELVSLAQRLGPAAGGDSKGHWPPPMSVN